MPHSHRLLAGENRNGHCLGCSLETQIATNLLLNKPITIDSEHAAAFRSDPSIHKEGCWRMAGVHGRMRFDEELMNIIAHAPECSVQAPSRSACAIGDLHGDLDAAMECFRACPCIEARFDQTSRSWGVKWKDGSTYAVVQCGDVVDRERSGGGRPSESPVGDDEELILFACHMLSLQSRKQGGLFVRLIGNHEMMNVMGNVDFATERSLQFYERLHKRQGGRAYHFQPGGMGARQLGAFGSNAVIRLGNFVFMHAGIGDAAMQLRLLSSRGHGHASPATRLNAIVHSILTGESLASWPLAQPFLWDRTQGASPEGRWCTTFQSDLKRFVGEGASDARLFLVVGHSITPGITRACDVFRIDVAMSRAFDGDSECDGICQRDRMPQVLHILDLETGEAQVEYGACLARECPTRS